MKLIKDKEILVGADFAGFPLKEAVCEQLLSIRDVTLTAYKTTK